LQLFKSQSSDILPYRRNDIVWYCIFRTNIQGE